MKINLFLIPLLAIFNLLPGLSIAQHLLEEEPPENYKFQVFLEEEEALAKVFAGCDKIESESLTLTSEGREYFKELLKRPDLETTFQVYIGKKGDVISRYAIITEEMGCFHPITWILSTNAEGEILDIAVMIYRESRGHEVSRKRFLKQFEGKSIKNSFSPNKDIIKITGATVSVQAVCRGVRKMLAFIHEFYINNSPASKTLARRITSNQATLANVPRQLFTTARVIGGVKAVVAAEVDGERKFFSVADKVFNEMERIEKLFKKELKALNSVAGKTAFSCNKEVFEVVKRCYQYGVLTEGTFDITVSPLLEEWGIYKGKLKEVKKDRLLPILMAVSYKNIQINDNDEEIFFTHKQTKMDVGPVVRGYAVDKALELVKESGITSVCINYGSVTRMIEPPSGKNAWKIGVPHPIKGDSVIGSLSLTNKGVAFAADYSRYPSVQDKIYNHLVDPKLGKPITGGILAVTAVANTAEEAGALATTLFVTGVSGGQRLQKIFPYMGYVFLHEKSQNNVEFLVSSNILEKFVGGEEKIFKYGKGSGCPFSP
ncbi:MAG: FMN-binding protein [Planctomycetes bacterium]|nr:FMN-binding protein [Planctomycetota bacterium]